MAGSTDLRWGGASDVGRVRSNNQDNFLARDDMGLWVVADGMGGHRGGEIASDIACATMGRTFASHTVDGLITAIESANAAVYDAGAGDPDLSGMGTTIVALAMVDDAGDEVLAIANVGDSRAYRLADGELDQLTTDHSLVADMVREGSLSPEEAAVHPQRNILTRVLGVYDDVPVDVVTVLPRQGDRYVLCSDGLFNEVPESGIASVLRRLRDPAEVADELVRLANEGGGRDNVTVVVVDVIDDAGRAEMASAALAGEASSSTRELETLDDLATEMSGRRARRRKRRGGESSPRHRAGDGRRSRRVTWRVVVFVALLLGLAAGVVATIQWYGESAYYVGFDGDRVAIYKGRPGGVLWVDPSLVETTDLSRDAVRSDTERELSDGKEWGSLSEARNYVDNLAEQAEPPTTTTTTTSRPGGTTTTTRGTTTTTRR
ncbi:MAG TPA: Stp1/IreP family PP2C-type Ser/Thr phosphatase [Acidimicrobiales bacterium]